LPKAAISILSKEDIITLDWQNGYRYLTVSSRHCIVMLMSILWHIAGDFMISSVENKRPSRVSVLLVQEGGE